MTLRILALTAALLTVASCGGGQPGYAPYDQGCDFNSYCPHTGGF